MVIAEPTVGGLKPAQGQKAIMDQRKLMFVPDVLVVQTGTAVDFPNSDQVRHQVYSFSGAKTFELALYAGRAHAPVVFDRSGLVTLGCNIHDSMVGYIWVTDSPWSDAAARTARCNCTISRPANTRCVSGTRGWMKQAHNYRCG